MIMSVIFVEAIFLSVIYIQRFSLDSIHTPKEAISFSHIGYYEWDLIVPFDIFKVKEESREPVCFNMASIWYFMSGD